MDARARRLAGGALLVVVALGLTWSTASIVHVGTFVPVGRIDPATGDAVARLQFTSEADYYAETAARVGYQNDARLLLVPVAILLAWAATHRVAGRAVALAAAGLGVLLALALLKGSPAPAVAIAAALLLVRPYVTRHVSRTVGV